MKLSHLTVTDLEYAHGGQTAVAGISHSFRAGQLNVLAGPNGAGKTTLLRLAAGLLAPSRGAVNLTNMAFDDPVARAQYLAYLPQFADTAWPLAAEQVVALGLLPEGAMPRATHEARVRQALAQCGAAEFWGRPVTELSGGERARVMLARLLVSRAEFLLLDEPVQSLDPTGARDLLDVLTSEARVGRGVILVLHDMALAQRYAEHAVLMQAGRVFAAGPCEQVFTKANLTTLYGTPFEHFGELILPA